MHRMQPGEKLVDMKQAPAEPVKCNTLYKRSTLTLMSKSYTSNLIFDKMLSLARTAGDDNELQTE